MNTIRPAQYDATPETWTSPPPAKDPTFIFGPPAGGDVSERLAETRPYPMYPNPPRPCVVVAQDGELSATVLFEVEGDRIKRIDLCEIPPPHTCQLSGESPGLIAAYGVPPFNGPVA